MPRSVITGTGAGIPERIQVNQDFAQHSFFDEKSVPLSDTTEAIVEKFRKITGITARRYVPNHLNASEKMDEEIVKRLYALYGLSEAPSGIMPMSIQWLGNSSVATIPTLYHLFRHGKMPEHEIKEGDIILFASVGAGMNINAVCYGV